MSARTDPPKTGISVELLGHFRVGRHGDGTGIRINSRRGRALIAYLAMHLDRSLPRSRVASLLWEDRTETAARHNLRQVLTELREEIGDALDGGLNKDTVGLRSAQFDVDVARFVEHCRNGTLEDLEAAVALYAGDLTHDAEIKTEAFDEWISVERRRLHRLALNAFDACARGLDDAGRKKEALAVCERLLALDPIREATHRLLIELEVSVNGRSSALNRAEQLAASLRDQLGVTPEPATLELVAAVSKDGFGERNLLLQPRPAPPPPSLGHPGVPRPGPRFFSAGRLAIAAVAAAAVIGAAWYAGISDRFANFSEPPGPKQVMKADRPLNKEQTERPAAIAYSIAVLPFSDRSGNDRVKQFLRVMEQDIIDSLSHAPRFLTISHQTTRSYLDTQQDARTIGRELGTDFLLTGNADADGTNIVVRAQLIDSRNGQQVWAGKFDHALDSKNDVFEEIVNGISRELQVEIMLSEGLRRAKSERKDPTFSDLIMRGHAETFQSFNNHRREDSALALFEQALRLHPDSAAAKVGVVRILTRRVSEFRSPDRHADVEQAEKLLTDVLRDSPDISSARYFLGIVRKLQGRMQDSVVEFERALKLNPSLANAHAQLGHSLIFLGRAAESEKHILKAIRHSPRDPTISSWYLFAGQATLYLDRYDDAIRYLNKSLESYPDSGRTHIFLAAAYVLDGKPDAAAQAMKTGRRLLPKFQPDNLRNVLAGQIHPEFVVQRKRLIQAVEQAMTLTQTQ